MTGWRLWLCVLLALPLLARAGDVPTLTLQQAEFVASDADTPPAQGWQAVTLPDVWRLSHPQLSGFAWYRLRFELQALPQEPLALYLPHLSMAGELWLNGSLLTPNVRYDSPSGRMGSQMENSALHLILPSGLFQVGDNQLLVRLQGHQLIRSGLSAVVIGPTEVVAAQWRQRAILQEVIPYIFTVLIAGSLAFLLAHAWNQRRLHLIHFAMLLSLPSALVYQVIELPISRIDQQALRILVTIPMYWWLCLIGYRMAHARARWYPLLLNAVSVLTLVATLVMWWLGTFSDRQLWLATVPHLLLRVPVAVLLLRHAWRTRSFKFWALGLSVVFWLVTHFQSYLLLMEWLDWDDVRWSPSGGLPFAVVMLFFFAGRFIQERAEAAQEQRAAIAAERGRILQDMHDGMGAQLITALRLARREDADRSQLIGSIEESLQDMRLIVDSLDMTDHDLLPLLGNLRFRLEPRLSALGIHLQWDVQPVPPLDYLTPESVLAILRIVQEAINNALQHANPRQLRITVRPLAQGIQIVVADDGHGFSPVASGHHSHGLRGMQQRADKLGAQLQLSSDLTGTRVQLTLPPHRSA